MAELNPIALWRRFLALPNESRAKTLIVAFLVSAICALMVSGATVVLRPIQAANRAAEQQARLENLIAGIPGMSDLLSAEGGALSTVVIDLERGAAAKEVTPETLPAALEDSANWTTLTAGEDLAGLGQRPDYAQIYLLRDANGAISLALLPISGAGYNGPIDAIIALKGDMNTVAGMAITGQSETPGLGARIEEPSWLAQFSGRQISDARGDIRFAVARGSAGNEYEVDGITGATRTSNAITRMVRFWLGPDGYAPLLTAIRRGEF
ncbi:NADH:ubiquinone reductase (Na(+)-transporting) subunit C [Nitratireductor aquimarinus]|uniref:Na(+)-translocating NADH-quinone reductase subunit C n=1 Tax=Nitratireductor aquimarinus TaxID=889300 RepID=A0ABU4AMT9_9HYPH|nr:MULTISPECIES: NADH:ubiquinone reductase (Na(+)-transporting) subunit C [Alphaproteobacteria]MBY6022993.1 NADH:ubiquinone reductase (Na(+)-transporting) subunit C [Nitratireductor sp. DP7N14-4]MBN7758200.1 NADH:ubiquinone reductase (Na(+)-transporting) subunit C [Nitratireductor aquimarinus]MBN7760328.1 NADH:ubiquinone reductase (Na(+)-transporting) subunit C [Nitratireductor aquibiodomus]MBY6000961.1 NADH:ubiquinone reductase (Na(+)-transporting) subunit C [Tritonibacter mobilis]MCV0349425.